LMSQLNHLTVNGKITFLLLNKTGNPANTSST